MLAVTVRHRPVIGIRREAGNVMDGGYDYLKLERMAYYVHKDSYRKAVLAQSKAMREEQHSLARARQRVAGAR